MTYRQLSQQLSQIYSENEAKAISRLVYEHFFGLSFADVLCGKDEQLTCDEKRQLTEIIHRLLLHEPIQYIIGHETFCGRNFSVDKNVLIPRPETELLCRWAEEIARRNSSDINILDVGTGSGCIAITLNLNIQKATVDAIDVSDGALAVARENAKQLHAQVNFRKEDILNHGSSADKRYDIIVSNPPYICEKEKKEMDKNVLNHEPHSALFVADSQPLLFYEAITDYAKHTLTADGWLLFEVNRAYADDVAAMMSARHMREVEVRTDNFGQKRMVGGKL